LAKFAKAPSLSPEAKHRLDIMDFYYGKSAQYDRFSRKNATVTCRHFGISRSYFYKWLNRYDKSNLKTLESRSTRPNKCKTNNWSSFLIEEVTKIREAHPTYSSKKISVILNRDLELCASASTVQRIINNFNLYFNLNTKAKRTKLSQSENIHKVRKPLDLKTNPPNRVVEFDMKHIHTTSKTYYAFVGIDFITKQTVIHADKTSSSAAAKRALEKIVQTFGTDIVIVNDNGSENMGEAHAYLQSQHIIQYWTRPRKPKDKACVERVIGTFQRECLDNINHIPNSVEELQNITNQFLNDYHFYRPHASLNYSTPNEYCATLNIVIRRAEVSTMY
jgi:transposase InsO family protein